jgi:hypothetical protein
MKFFVVVVFLSSFLSYSQELNCQVNISTDAKLEITSVEKEIIEQLKQSIFDLMNNTQWTKDKFSIEERVNCQIQLQISSIPSAGSFSGAIQVQSTRTGFNSSYNTTIFNFLDEDLVFSYNRNTQFTYAQNQYRDNLISILSFYAYFILGMDYDSYSLKGGSPYFTEAQNIVSLAQSSGAPGWKSDETGKGKKNRYWLVDNIQHQLFEPLRECNYEYHRKGIDQLYANRAEAQKAIYSALSKLNRVSSTRPNSINLLNFVQGKQVELRNLYLDAEAKDKSDLVTLLKKLDPANASKYDQIMN